MKKLVLVTALLTTSFVAASARADGRGEFGFVLFGASLLVPSELGVDRALSADARPQLRLGWAFQIPLGIFGRGDWLLEESPLWQHRVVVSVSMLYGRDVESGGPELHLEGFDFRGGYRYRLRPRRALAPYFGLGLGTRGGVAGTPERRGDGQPYVSPELGVHFGRDGVWPQGRDGFWPGMQLGLQGAVFSDASPVRIQGVASWTLW